MSADDDGGDDSSESDSTQHAESIGDDGGVDVQLSDFCAELSGRVILQDDMPQLRPDDLQWALRHINSQRDSDEAGGLATELFALASRAMRVAGEAGMLLAGQFAALAGCMVGDDDALIAVQAAIDDSFDAQSNPAQPIATSSPAAGKSVAALRLGIHKKSDGG
jgi:hypothetical protein